MIENLCEYIWNLIPQKDVPKRFIGDMPSLSDEGVALAITDGQEVTSFFGSSSTLARPNLRCFVRTKEYRLGATLSRNVYSAIQGYHDEDVLGIVVQGSTNYLGKNEEKLHEFQTNFKVLVKE
nr:MAG TPA: hypothetical protein [Caudoviricetes sp.]